MKKTHLALALGLVSSTVLVGCDSSSSSASSPTTPTVNYSVTAIDGYLQNAKVWLDINGNYQLDDGEPSAQSGKDGVANLDVTNTKNPEQYPVIVQAIAGQTIDIGTDVSAPENNLVNTSYMMSAPAGETDITPLSTLVHVVLEQNIANSTGSELTDEKIRELKAKAVSQIADQLGIASEDVLGDFIEENKDAIIFAAENVVAANILPETPEDLTQVIEEVKKDDPDNTASNDSTFLATTQAVTSKIKTTIDKAVTEAGGEEKVNFKEVTDIFDGTQNSSKDTDNDGVPDFADAFPEDRKEWVDTDSDGTGNNADTDDDGDDVADTKDAFPLNKNESVDTDNDHIGNNADTDDDGDGVNDTEDKFPENPNKAVADRVTTDSYTTPFMDWLSDNAVIVDVDVKKTVESLTSGNIQTTTVTTYTTKENVVYGTVTESDVLATDGSFSRTSSYRYDYNEDGTTSFEGKKLDIGTRTAAGEIFWRYVDETDGAAEGVNNGENRTFEGVDFSSRTHPADLANIDIIQKVTTTWSASDDIRKTKASYKQYNVSGFVLADTSTHVLNYAESNEWQEKDGRMIARTKNQDWEADNTINRSLGFTAVSASAYTEYSNGPVWADPTNGHSDEYADFNYTPDNWDNLTSYWYEFTRTTDLQQDVVSETGKRYVLDQTKNADGTEANVKLVNADNPNGLLFHEWAGTFKEVSDTEENATVSWTHYPLDGYEFTTATKDSGQAYRVYLKQNSGIWVTYSFDEWGSQNVADLATRVEKARSGGTNVADIDSSIIPGLNRYAAVLPNDYFRQDDVENVVQWYLVTNNSELTDGSPTLLTVTLTDNGLKDGWYVFNNDADFIVAKPKESKPWNWYNAYDRMAIATESMDLTSGDFSWTTNIGQFFLDRTAAQNRLNEITQN